jgi:DNA-binding PadR family transcriptional regulator
VTDDKSKKPRDLSKRQTVTNTTRRPAAPTDVDEVGRQLRHPKGDLKACLLVLIARTPAHGYELVDSLRAFGYTEESPARVYRALRWLEESGLLQPSWEISGTGPARRVYAVTEKGQGMVERCVDSLRARTKALETQISSVTKQSGEPTAGSSYEVLVEAKLSVVAGDVEAAREAVQAALGPGRQLGADVKSTGQVWVYEAVRPG